MSRRAFIGSMAGAAGVAMTAGLLPTTVLAKHTTPAPKPTTFTGDLPPFHLTFFGPTEDPSSIWDFNGFVGVAQVQGTGTATSEEEDSEEQLLFDTDMRFMSGVYVGQDGKVHKGTFGFV